MGCCCAGCGCGRRAVLPLRGALPFREPTPPVATTTARCPTLWGKGQRGTKQPNQDENTDFKITALFLNYPKMLQVWNATEFVFLTDDCVGFKVSTPIYKGTVIITWQDNSFYSVNFRDMDLKILGISDAEKVLDAVKDYVEMGEVWV